MRVNKKPVEARQLTWEDADAIAEWCGGVITDRQAIPHGGMWVTMTIPGVEGSASMLDWIVEESKGEFCVYSPDSFAATYEEAK